MAMVTPHHLRGTLPGIACHFMLSPYLSGGSTVQKSILLVQAPVVGRWSDAYGRKPFLILSFACGGAQVIVLLLYITRGTSLLWYFPAQARPSLLVPLWYSQYHKNIQCTLKLR